MKILIDIPDRYEGRNLFVFAGMDLVARRYCKKPWEIKISDCAMCGKCCQNLNNDKFPFKIINGVCEHLEHRPGKRYLCKLDVRRPFGCAIHINENVGCAVRFKELK
jgi:hypothetical protein